MELPKEDRKATASRGLVSCCNDEGDHKLDFNKFDCNKLDFNKLDYNKLDLNKLDCSKLDCNKDKQQNQIHIQPVEFNGAMVTNL